jgi:DNA-binding CsgD family transcriptional regulator
VTTALREAQARTFAAGSAGDGLPPGPTVLLLSADLEVVRQTPGTLDRLRLLVPRDDAGPPVPAGAYNVAAQLLAVEAGVDRNPPTARVHLAGGTWVTLRAARLAERDIAVTIEASTPAERLAVFGRASGLSEREQELLGLLAAGSDTREIAAGMHLSAYTVQDHLKSVFAKTGTRSRRALLAHALGN